MLATLIATAAVVVPTVWAQNETPDSSAFMRAHKGPYFYERVELNHISRHLIAAAIAHEDPYFTTRTTAFDLSDFKDRALEYLKTDDAPQANGDRAPGGSTIPQQLVKNLYLTPERSLVRKGIEALIAYPTSVTMSKPRIMDLYLNFAQFGPDIFGACAASWYYFNSAPWDLTEVQASQLAAVLPMPASAVRVRAPEGGIYIADAEYDQNKYRPDVTRNIPARIEYAGGYRKMMDAIGIHDDASAHASTRGTEQSCSTMPKMVQSLLTENGY